MPPDSYVDWGAVHFYAPLNRTGEQILTDEEINQGSDKHLKYKYILLVLTFALLDDRIK